MANEKSIDVPYTASDLRYFADVLDEAEKIFGDFSDGDNQTDFGRKLDQISLNVVRQDTEDVSGVIEYYDGWLGFYPVHRA